MVVEDDIARTKQDIEKLDKKLEKNKELHSKNFELRKTEKDGARINWYNSKLNELLRAAADINKERKGEN